MVKVIRSDLREKRLKCQWGERERDGGVFDFRGGEMKMKTDRGTENSVHVATTRD